MNIFILDKDLEKCAKSHVDKHFKQILEAAQLACTTIRVLGGKKTILTDPLGKNKAVYLLPDETYKWIKQEKKVKRIDDYGNVVIDTIITYKLWLSSGLYVQSHVNHPCSAWVRESWTNFNYLTRLMIELEKEWQFRFKHTKGHKSVVALTESNILALACQYFPNENKSKGLTPFPIVMPDEYKVECDAVQSYRNYYNGAKRDLHKWTNREKPEWII